MPSITYTYIHHKSENRILVQFPPNNNWNKRMQQVHGVYWSKTFKGWTIPDTPENRYKCKLPVNQPPQANAQQLTIKNQLPAGKHSTLPVNYKPATKTALLYLSYNNKNELQKFLKQLTLKAYSPLTIRTYRIEFAQLLQLLGEMPVQNLQPQHLQRYILHCIKKGLSEHGVHSRINALKFYFEQVLHREKFFFEIPRPKRPQQLPKLLNENELARLFNAIENKKHKAVLFTAYSAGLRVSEVVNLKIKDIDSRRMQVFIQRAKGKKDRYVNLSPYCSIFCAAI